MRTFSIPMQSAALGLLPLAVAAQDRYLKFEQFELGNLKWFLYAVVLALIVISGARYLRSLAKPAGAAASRRKEKERELFADFRSRAASLGFKENEAKTLERIARRLAPKTPTSLLTASTGREYLMGDLDKRISKRQRR